MSVVLSKEADDIGSTSTVRIALQEVNRSERFSSCVCFVHVTFTLN